MIFLYLMSAVYIFAGIMHFVKPRFYRPMMPPYIPWHNAMIALSGVAELALGVGLLIPSVRSLAAWGVIALLIAVSPVHIYMLQVRKEKFAKIPLWFLLARLPMQILLMVWAYLYT